MPRWSRWKNHQKSVSLSEQHPAAARAESKEGRLNMLEEIVDFEALSSPKRTNSPINVSPAIPETPTSSWFTVSPHLVEITRGKAAKVSPADSYHEDAATYAQTSDLAFLQFCPTESTDYARLFARAVLAAYKINLFPGASQKDRISAERVLQGEGSGLFFRPDYIAKRVLWNGEDARSRRAALAHILGVSGADCKIEGCPYRGSSCLGCGDSALGVFQGCRHSHENPLKLGCANCAVGTTSSGCTVREVRKQAEKVCQEHPLKARDSMPCIPPRALTQERTRSSHGLVQSSIYGLEDRRPTAQIGPVLNDFFISRRVGSPNDFDIWMAMRKRAIDYEPEILAMECRLAKLWSSVLEDELGKQKAAGFSAGERA